MFIERLKNTFGINIPIFADEIVHLFENYTRAYVFRLIEKAEKAGELLRFSRGVYYIPTKTFFGESSICSEMVAKKKYLCSNGSVYGIYSGLNLLNQFGITTQVPNTCDIITNKETTRKRKITINGREFILRRSRCEITSENYPAYTLMQLFLDMDEKDELDDFSRDQIERYISEYSVTKDNLFAMAMNFPSSALKRLIKSGVINGAA